jgi:integrase
MSVFRRGKVYWYEFTFNGARIRESAKTTSKTIAKQAESQRRRELELGFNRIPQPKRMPLFKLAAEQWLATKRNLSRFTGLHYRQYVASLSAEFADRLICDIRLDDIAKLQQKRQAQGQGNRSVNAEIQVLRQILKHFGLWAALQGRLRFLREPHDTGRALSHQDEASLLQAAGQSRSPALLSRLTLALDTGLRANEMRQLRHQDLNLAWSNGAIEQGWLTVSRSKTEAGTGRTIPLSRRACAVLTLWLSRFPEALADGYLFPRHKVGFAGDKRKPFLYEVDFSRPGVEWRSAWTATCLAAGVRYRWHDLRHTFVSRLAENPAVSEQTIMALAGHVSRSMLARYSHIRSQAKQAAIDALEARSRADFAADSPQNPPQPGSRKIEPSFTNPEKALN